MDRNTYIIKKSNRLNKKYVVEQPNGRKIHFGDSRYQDYTQHKDPNRKKLYIARHARREDWNDKNTAGYWARWLLWNLPSIESSKKDIEHKLKNAKIQLKI